MEELTRTELLIGLSGVEKLKKSKVAVFGVGGVGGYVVEALARSGVGRIDVIDKDKVSLSNINRQIIALHSTVDRYKTEVIKERVKDINPEIEINAINEFFLPENSQKFDFTVYDYVIDAVDTVTAKIEIIKKATESGVKVISAMGAGNKLDATAFKVDYIENTSVCPLCKVMRRELKKRGIEKVKVVYSREEPIKNSEGITASIAYVPSVMGLIIAGEVIKDLIKV